MANVETKTRSTSTQQSLLVKNGATGLSGSAVVVLDSVDATAYERASIQIINEGEGATITAKVFGSLVDAAGTVGGSNWTQIGDDIEITNNSNAMKSIATTGLRKLGVTMSIASGTPTFNAGNCLMFLQGTI
jgi:hypothetical protein|tara:strand:- start:253 stop:648 length:396 start_codon:yes stop_codon:yes gene_type:complete